MISVVINCDSRPQRDEQGGLFSGVTNMDFLTDGILNKSLMFKDFDHEIIVYIDEHVHIPMEDLEYIRSIAHTVVVRQHTGGNGFNDMNYIRALQMASGDYVFHFDQDIAAFVPNKQSVQDILDLLETYDYVSYPSHWTPNAVADPNYNYRWVSTRFFACKRKTLNFAEIIKCLTDYDYFVSTYKPSRVNPWTEHILGLISNSNVFYPPIDYNKLILFCWETYETYTLKRLNHQSFEEVRDWVIAKGGIFYPNNLNC